jgi:Flp pilus assembly protein TadD
MPETTYMGVDARRDHRLGVPRPAQSVARGVPNACTGCHVERSAAWAAETVAGWYGHQPTGFQQFADAFHGTVRGEARALAALSPMVVDASQPAIVRASALARLSKRPTPTGVAAASAVLDDRDPMVRRAALLVLEALPPPDRVRLVLPRLADAARAVRIQAAWLLAPSARLLVNAEDREAFERASAEFVESQRYTADRPESRVTLGAFFAQLDRLDEAAVEYQAALRLSPAFTGAWVNLADVYRAQGREADAERTLRAGLAVSPDAPELHHALGLSLARSGRTADSVAALARAAALAPERADLAYAHAVALHSSGRVRQAISVLEQASARHPDDPSLLFALATFHRDAGDIDDAIRHARRLAELRPGDAQARALLESLR